MTGLLRQPDRKIVTKERALAVLRRLGLDWACEPGLLPWPLPPVVPLSRKSNRDWWVGDESMVSYQGDDDGFPLKGIWSSDRNARHGGQCSEVAAAILVHCWNMPQYKPMFNLPEWELELHDVVAGRQSQQEMYPLGRIRYRLTDAPSNRPDALPLERELIRWSRSDGRAMRPRLMTDDGSEIRLDRACINNEDSAIHDLVSLLRQWNRSTVQSAGPKVADFRQRVIARVFDHLLDVDDLWYGEARLKPIRTPFLPTLTAVEEGDEISLSWEPLIIKLYPFGNGFAVCADGTIRPLADSRLLEVSNRLIEGLPRLSVDEVDLFVDRVVLASALPCLMDGPRLPEILDADRITGRIRLYEDESFLCLDLAYVYRLDGDEYEVAAATLNSQHRSKRGIFRRDPHREANLRAEARATLGVALPARIEGDAAYRILLDGLPRLPEGWHVDADRDLLRFKVSGRLATKVSVPSETDWLDLKVEFSHDGQVIDSLDVLKSWRKGERFHRLDDGTLVHLPMEWLQRHGVVHEELEAIRATNEGRIPHYAAPMLADLIGEADGDVSIWEERMAELEEASSVPDRVQPSGLKADLREYQQAGFRWLAWLKDRSFGGVLADDMGLGKTVQALALLLDEHQSSEGGQSLVVAPTSVIYAWEEEAARFTPDLKVVVYHGSNRPKEPPEDADIIVTSYGLLRYAADAFKRSWKCLVLDEAQRIKNPESHVAKVARGLTASFRLALTGTPLENRLLELWSILECLMPGFFGPRTAFRRRYSIPIERNRDEEALSRLQRRIRPFILRRLKSEVAQELPPRQEQVLYCELGPEQRRLYERVRNTYRQSVLKKVNETGVGRSTLPVLEALMRLRQACCDPGLLPFPEAEEVKESAKLDLLVNTLDKTIPAGHRTLVFSQWTSLLQRVIPRLDKNNWTYLYLDGRTTKRHELVKKWNDPEGPPVFLISLRAGGAGLNLTGADHVIHLDPWWNPAVEDQATDRAHRIGQTKPVVAYRFVARDTVEEKVIALQDRKRALFDMTVEQGRFPVNQLTREDIESFFDGDAQPGDDSPAEEMSGVSIDVDSASKEQASNILLDHEHPLTPAIVVELTGWPEEEADAWLDDQVNLGTLEAVNHDDGRHFIRAE